MNSMLQVLIRLRTESDKKQTLRYDKQMLRFGGHSFTTVTIVVPTMTANMFRVSETRISRYMTEVFVIVRKTSCSGKWTWTSFGLHFPFQETANMPNLCSLCNITDFRYKKI